ncbi:MAG: SnoaL-like domain [Solirubrobacteraceae bacterium]|jgi:ketosteroid isomerase-like protein|nr:SnoaL-like domain [Solirubrobacteraceae bacterium]
MDPERDRLLARIYDAANRGDFDGLAADLAPDVEWRAPTRTIRGRNAVAGWLTGWHASYRPHHEVRRLVHAGADTVALVRIDYEGRDTNVSAHVWTVVDGLVARVRIFPAPEQGFAALGLDYPE